MGKKSKTKVDLFQKDETKCKRGLISIFDFWQSCSNQKLISDGRPVNELVLGSGYPKSKLNLSTNANDKQGGIKDGRDNKTLSADAYKRSVKTLMEEERIAESKSGLYIFPTKKQKNARKSYLRDYHENENRTREVHRNNTSEDIKDAEAFIDETLRKYISEDRRNHQSQHFLDALNILKSNEELFLKHLEDPNSLLVEHIRNLQYLHAEKERSKWELEAKLSETVVSTTRNCEEESGTMKLQKQNLYYLISRKIKTRYEYQSKLRNNPRALSRIVASNTGTRSVENPENVSCHCSSLHSNHSSKNKNKSVDLSYFPFRNMKNMSKSATGDNQKPFKEGDNKEDEAKIATIRIIETSPLEDKTKRKEDRPRDSKSGIKSEIAPFGDGVCTVRYSKKGDFDIHMEAKRHLSEMLSNVNRGKTSSGRAAPKLLGRILHLPQQDFLFNLSPKRDVEDGVSTAAQMRFSPYINLQMASESSSWLQKENQTSCSSSSRQNTKAPPCINNRNSYDQCQIVDQETDNILQNCLPDTKGRKSISSATDDFPSDGHMESKEEVDISQPEENNILEVPSSPRSINDTMAKQSFDTASIYERVENLDSSREDSPLKYQQLISSVNDTSSTPLSIHKLDIADSIRDRTDHLSPVSVLEPFFIEDFTSRPSTTTQPAKPPIQPLHIAFDEHSPEGSSPNINIDSDFEVYCPVGSPANLYINSETSTNSLELISAYMEALLQASCLSWNELLLSWQWCRPSNQFFSPSLIDGFKLPFISSFCDQSLLIDCINEAVAEVYQCYFGCSHCLSSRKTKPVLEAKSVADEIIQRVNRCFLPRILPRTIEQLAGEDHVSSWEWTDILPGIEEIVIQIVDSVVEELVAETMFEFLI